MSATSKRMYRCLRAAFSSVAVAAISVQVASFLGGTNTAIGQAALLAGAALGYLLALWPSAPPKPATLPSGGEPCKDVDAYGQFTVDLWMGDGSGELDVRQHSIMALGLAGETGEVTELLKKWLRDGKLDRVNLRKELGDVSYYWARLCRAHGFQPSEVLGENMHKISDRKTRGVLHGSGDDR